LKDRCDQAFSFLRKRYMDGAKDQENFYTLLETIGDVQRGSLLTGQVIAFDPLGVVVDLGLKRDGVIPTSDLDRLPPDEVSFHIGDQIDVLVIDPVDADGNLVVSISQARESDDWSEAKRLLENDEIFEASATSFNRGGLIVPFGRLRGFVPASHLSGLPRGLDEPERASYLERYINKNLPFKVLEVDPQRHRLVLSERKAVRQWRQLQKAEVIKTLKEGDVRKGVVTSLREFGAFVDIGGADGLIHISELAWRHIDNPGQVLEIGQEIETLVIRLDIEANRIGLSLKRLQDNPWHKIMDQIQVDMVLTGTVTRHVMSGLYVKVEDGIEGLVKSQHTHALPQVGESVQVRVVSFEPERERMGLELIEMDSLVPQTALADETTA
jgi:small subunit ribosomal protein S1